MSKRAKYPFRFSIRLNFPELTGYKASNIIELIEHIKVISGSCIYHHTHRFLQIHKSLSPEPPNDFAYWIAEFLGEHKLAEKLASIDIIDFRSIRRLREVIIKVIEDYIKENPSVKKRFVNKGDEFYFIKSISFVFSSKYLAKNLYEFVDILRFITIDSIYFHIFEAKLRLEKQMNDFSYWIDTSVGDKELAQKIALLDPYTHTLEGLRKILIDMIEERI